MRAHRGTRRTSVYRDRVVPAQRFARIVATAAELRLDCLASLASPGRHRLDKRQARRLAVEAELVRRSAAVLELDDDLAAIADVARWCARASGPAWLTVGRP